MLALTRCAPLLLSHAMVSRGVTLERLEERILLIAEVTARSRQQRRERERRKREASLGSGGENGSGWSLDSGRFEFPEVRHTCFRNFCTSRVSSAT